jgi:hypothetical protein
MAMAGKCNSLVIENSLALAGLFYVWEFEKVRGEVESNFCIINRVFLKCLYRNE